jgi:hypothetical protein
MEKDIANWPKFQISANSNIILDLTNYGQKKIQK